MVFDIETGALPLDSLIVPDFKPASNIKDADKIAKNIEEKKSKWESDLALHADTAEILAIGYYDNGEVAIQTQEKNTEAELIQNFFDIYEKSFALIGFNIFKFDIPFIVHRAWFLSVPVPKNLIIKTGKNRFYPEKIIDIREVYEAQSDESVSLNKLAQFFGYGKKEHDGLYYSQMFREGKIKEANEYLLNDLEMTSRVAERLLGSSAIRESNEQKAI